MFLACLNKDTSTLKVVLLSMGGGLRASKERYFLIQKGDRRRAREKKSDGATWRVFVCIIFQHF